MKSIYCADFETIEKNNIASVYLWALSSKENMELNNVIIGNTIESFIKKINTLSQKNSIVIYFYNLKFDGVFIIDYLIKNNYYYDKTNFKPNKKNSFTTLIDYKRIIYQIVLKTKYNNIYIKCAYRLSMISLRKLAINFNTKYKKIDIDNYDSDLITDEKIKYIKHDTLIVCEYIKFFYKTFNNKVKLTLGSQALQEWKKLTYKWYKYRDSVSYKVDRFLRKAYRGGLCVINKKYENKEIRNIKGAIYDINSSYSYSMHSISKNKFPISSPCYFKGDKELKKIQNKKYLYIVRFECTFKIKKNKVECITTLGSSYTLTKWQRESKEIVELTLCNVDYDLFLKNYNVKNINIIDGYYFEKSKIGIADKFINKYYKIKKKENTQKKYIAKLMLNSLTGKFGQKRKTEKKFFILNKNEKKLYTESEEEIIKGIYLPYVIYITAYARAYLVNIINKNYKNFIYCDTDSIHIKNNKLIGAKIGTELGEFKKENTIINAKYLKQKAYLFENENNEIKIKISGLPEEARPIYNNFDLMSAIYKIGATFIAKRLQPKIIEGGVILTPTDYTIKEQPEY